MSDLLPHNKGAFEAVYEAVLSNRFFNAASEIKKFQTLFDPWTCSPEHLSLLAWAFSVDIWQETWSLSKKRNVVATARRFHTLKTTVAGFRMALSYLDASLVRAYTPKEGFFLSRNDPEKIYQEWLAAQPELRIYTDLLRPSSGKSFLDRKRFAASLQTAVLKIYRGERMTKEERVPLLFSGVSAEQGQISTVPLKVLIPYPVSRSLKIPGFLNKPVQKTEHKGFFLFSELGNFSAPQKTTPPQKAGSGIFIARPRKARFFRRTTRPVSCLSFRILEKSNPQSPVMRNTLGKSRFRRDPFTVSLLVHVARPRPHRSYKRHLHSGPEAQIKTLEQAVSVAQAARDTIFLRLNSMRSLQFADLKTLPQNARYGTSIMN